VLSAKQNGANVAQLRIILVVQAQCTPPQARACTLPTGGALSAHPLS